MRGWVGGMGGGGGLLGAPGRRFSPGHRDHGHPPFSTFATGLRGVGERPEGCVGGEGGAYYAWMTRSVRPSKNTAVSAPSMVPLPSASYLVHSLKQHAAGCTGQAGVGREGGGGVWDTKRCVPKRSRGNFPFRRGSKKSLVTSTETNVHGDAFCFMVMGPSLFVHTAGTCATNGKHIDSHRDSPPPSPVDRTGKK